MTVPPRVNNPAQVPTKELKNSFVVRHYALDELLRMLREQPPDRLCQHTILIGERGMGKTTLGLRFLQAVKEDPELAAAWQPVPFPEESYDIDDAGDFWLAALGHLTRATGVARWRQRADTFRKDVDPRRASAFALGTLLDFCDDSGKRLILFVENIDIVLTQIRDEREVHELRAAFMEHKELLVLGSANAVFDAITDYDKPFYGYFGLLFLDGLDRAECRRLLEAAADAHGAPQIVQRLDEARLETIRRLTGGNPRLLVLASRLLIESPDGSAFDDLERLFDEQTPYFKARLESLPIQARKVFHCLAENWQPMLAKEVSAAARLSSSHASAQLRQLANRGLVREASLPNEKRSRYEVADRLYNIYYLLRRRQDGRERLARLVEFLHGLFGQTGLLGEGGPANQAEVRKGPDRGDPQLLTTTLVARVAMGGAEEAKRQIEEANMADAAEPLWHAIRLELGEEVGPLPAEILDAVREIRAAIAARREAAAKESAADA